MPRKTEIDADDDTHEAASVGQMICTILKKHGVETSWKGTINTRITIDPFEWKRRRPIA